MNETVTTILEKVKVTAAAGAEAAGKALNKAGQKLGETVEDYRIHAQIADVRRQNESLFFEIGRVVYAAHCDPCADTEQVTFMLSAIDENKAIIDKLEESLRHNAEARVSPDAPPACNCPGCGRPCTAQDNFCAGCGVSIRSESI